MLQFLWLPLYWKVYKIKVNKYYIVATGKDFAKASK